MSPVWQMQLRRILTSPVGSVLALTCLALFVLFGAYALQAEPTSCERAKAISQPVAVAVCAGDYGHSGDPVTGAQLADLLLRAEVRDGATTFARSLLHTVARGDALLVLGKIARDQGDELAARLAFEEAHLLHVGQRRFALAAKDQHALSTVFTREVRFPQALRALDACIVEARAAKPGTEMYCHLAAADALGRTGFFDAALREIARSQPLAVTDQDHAGREVELAGVYQRISLAPPYLQRNDQAVTALTKAVIHARLFGATELMRTAELNLAYSHAELDRTIEADWHLAIADQLLVAPDARSRARHDSIRARIAFHAGEYARADRLNRSCDALADKDPDQRLKRRVLQAKIDIALGRFEDAIEWAKQGIEIVETMRSEAGVRELRPGLLAMRRAPYEALFVALARLHRDEEALLAFNQWQGRSLLDAVARDHATMPTSLDKAALMTEELQALLPALSSEHGTTPDPREMPALLAGVELAALVVAEHVLWRITALHGRVELVELGPLDKLQSPVQEFLTSPTRLEPAGALGHALLGDAVFRRTSQPLFVMLDAEIAGLQVAALRGGGEPLAAFRPIVRAAQLQDLRCVPAARISHAVVVADSKLDLHAALVDAVGLAASFHVVPATASNATADRLFAATSGDLLHIATHGDVKHGGDSLGQLFLAGGETVDALEIARRSQGPRLVVLSSCAAGDDDRRQGETSLVTAFRAAGSPQVVGTLHSVSDAGAAQVTHAFYRGGGIADPAKTLAAVQAALAATPNTDWPNFVVFGHDICRKEALAP